eukprot:GHVU01220651.1.p1 GENE.GHVU01220651.1~~GHVU01220651.1.p1  ORF type:complete len:220 (+),score=18.74 GHVU01220651.1:200-859(+)
MAVYIACLNQLERTPDTGTNSIDRTQQALALFSTMSRKRKKFKLLHLVPTLINEPKFAIFTTQEQGGSSGRPPHRQVGEPTPTAISAGDSTVGGRVDPSLPISVAVSPSTGTSRPAGKRKTMDTISLQHAQKKHMRRVEETTKELVRATETRNRLLQQGLIVAAATATASTERGAKILERLQTWAEEALDSHEAGKVSTLCKSFTLCSHYFSIFCILTI